MNLKIHFLSDSPRSNSGFAVVTKNIALGLKKLGYETSISGFQSLYPEFYKGIEILPMASYDEISQLQKNIMKINPDILIYINDAYTDTRIFLNVFPRTYCYVPVEGSVIPNHMIINLNNVAKYGKVIAQCKYAYEEMIKNGVKVSNFIYHGFNPEIFYPVNDKQIYSQSRYCYYRTDFGKSISDPDLLCKHGCNNCKLDINNKLKCEFYKEELVNIYKYDNEMKNWKVIENNVCNLERQIKNKKFVFLFVGANHMLRKQIGRLLEAYSIFISESKQISDRITLHLHSNPISSTGINLLEFANRLGIQNNINFSDNFSEKCLNILYNISDCQISASSSEGFCLFPETPILTLDRGIQKIKDIKIGDKVLTHSGIFQKVTQVMKRNYSGDMIKLIPYKIRIPIILTKEHIIFGVKTTRCERSKNIFRICRPDVECYYQRNGRKFKFCKYIGGEEPYRKYFIEWIEAKNLKIGNFVVFPRIKEVEIDIEKIKILDYIDDLEITGDNYEDNSIQTDLFGEILEKKICINSSNAIEIPANIELKKDFMRLCGYFIAEGNLEEYMIRFSFNSEEQEYVKDVENLMKLFFGLERHDDPAYDAKSCNIRFHSKIVSKFFENLFCPKEYQKTNKKTHIVRIPSEFINLPKEKLAELIKGIWRGDGNKDADRFSITTTSETLGYQLLYIISKFGILPTLRIDYTNKEKHENWSLSYVIQIDGKDAELFGKIINEDCIHKANNRRIQRYIKGKKFYYIPINKLDVMKYNGDVWNLEVEKDNSYACPIIVHNCLPVLEGFATGLPMIAPNTTSLTELIGNDKDINKNRGLLAKIQAEYMLPDLSKRSLVDIKDLALKMKEIYLKEDLRKEFSKNAVNWSKKFHWEYICNQWNDILKNV